MGIDVVRAASGILEIAAWSQANAVRQVTVKRGLDVRDYVLVAFGGSGPLQAGRLLDLLGIHAALVPPAPGNVSAFGLLTVDVRNDYVATAVQRHDRLDLERVNAIYADLERQAYAALASEGFPAERMVLTRSADVRYFGQASEVRVAVPADVLDRAASDRVVEQFHAAHERVYGYSYRLSQPAQVVEWVNLRVTGMGPIERPPLKPAPRPFTDGVARANSGCRAVVFDGTVETPVYQRDRLQPGDRLSGPAIVEEFGSTTVVYPRLEASVDDFGNLLLRRRQ
jgi:N-methylhydantoinase A